MKIVRMGGVRVIDVGFLEYRIVFLGGVGLDR